MWISADAYQEDPGIIHRVRMEVESLWQWTNAHIVSSSHLIDILGPPDITPSAFLLIKSNFSFGSFLSFMRHFLAGLHFQLHCYRPSIISPFPQAQSVLPV